jgi:hypothetical protein
MRLKNDLHPASFPRKRESRKKTNRGALICSIPAFAGMTPRCRIFASTLSTESTASTCLPENGALRLLQILQGEGEFVFGGHGEYLFADLSCAGEIAEALQT